VPFINHQKGGSILPMAVNKNKPKMKTKSNSKVNWLFFLLFLCPPIKQQGFSCVSYPLSGDA
jgi:hypothetical protein